MTPWSVIYEVIGRSNKSPRMVQLKSLDAFSQNQSLPGCVSLPRTICLSPVGGSTAGIFPLQVHTPSLNRFPWITIRNSESKNYTLQRGRPTGGSMLRDLKGSMSHQRSNSCFGIANKNRWFLPVAFSPPPSLKEVQRYFETRRATRLSTMIDRIRLD